MHNTYYMHIKYILIKLDKKNIINELWVISYSQYYDLIIWTIRIVWFYIIST